MPEIEYRTVADVNFEEFTVAFNKAYSDYYVPIVMTPSSFRALMRRDDLEPSASVAALDGDTIVGTGLLGIREHTGWIGGMGVVPSHRRQGIGRQMMHFLLDRAREHHLTTVKLEVIEANQGAHHLYQQIGFTDQRYLLILNRAPELAANVAAPYFIEECPPENVIEYYPAFHVVPNCWQRDLPSLHSLVPHLDGWAVLEAERVIGYAVGWTTPEEVRLVDVAADPAADPIRATQALLTYLHQENQEAFGSAYNIADDDPLLPAYQALGYISSFRQIEMSITL
jgi:GNAT superfamily N-acetyltransferase